MDRRSTPPARFRLRMDPARVSSLVGAFAAAFLAVVLNVLGARHYTRWDWTTAKRFTLSEPTLATLHELPDRVDVWVLLGDSEPLRQGVRQLLVAYAAETPKLEVHYVDPDKDALALEDVRKRFNIDTGRTADGHVVTDAIVVVASGARHWFLSPSDMVEVTSAEDGRVRPKEEQSFTQAIRRVISGEKAKICFTSGHGEAPLGEHGEQGLGLLKDTLEKDNYDVASVDTTAPDAYEPFKGCAVAVIAAPRGAFGKEEENRLRTFLLEGGNLLAVTGPVPAQTGDGFAGAGIDAALAPFGIALDADVVVETEPALAIPDAHGASFFVEPNEHAVTAALTRRDGQRDPPRVLAQFARSMHAVTPDGAAPAVPLLTTSARAFGVTTLTGAGGFHDLPERRPSDLPGPLVVAMASERPRATASAPRGGRVVVIGSSKMIDERNFREPLPLRGAAFLVENALSWLASRPQILDVPDKPAVAAGMRMSDESRNEVRRYVLVIMPLAFAALGIAIALRRRSTEGKPR